MVSSYFCSIITYQIQKMKKVAIPFIGLALLTSCSAASKDIEMPTVQLNNGISMPSFGIGTFMMPNNEVCKDAVLTALRNGYRHIDTARLPR